ncbi:GNAT family N-acetyltransferase [Pseudonocardiaceae bacterium YIM PH 21723]|nr:GNAT family N-acetyltransferase [Pseudonocardiaceae bacterium YIM PH 21723]
MTAVPAKRLCEFTADQLRERLTEALTLYVDAMRYPESTVAHRAPMWLAHMLRPQWRCVVALDEDDRLLGVTYGYQGAPGQWWHEQVRHGMSSCHSTDQVGSWMNGYFELTELHVRPDQHGQGIGERLLRELLREVRSDRVLLSTPEGPSRAWRLYRRVGFQDLLRNYQFTGDPRPFAVLGRSLPLDS